MILHIIKKNYYSSFLVRHLAHVGWDPNTGAFNVSNDLYRNEGLCRTKYV